MDLPPACIFEGNEMGNYEFNWSGLSLLKVLLATVVYLHGCNNTIVTFLVLSGYFSVPIFSYLMVATF